MLEFSSKLALNQALLEKNKAIKDGEVVAIKTVSTGLGKQEIKCFVKRCKTCGDLFFQSERCKYVYLNCDKCSKATKKKVEFPKDFI